MLSFDNNESAKPICIIKKEEKQVGEVFLYEKKKNVTNGFEELELQDGYLFQQAVNTQRERDCLYVAGMSGSGKSYYIREYVKQYIKHFPKRDILLFSFLKEDKTLDEIKKIQRIDIYQSDFMKEDLKSEDFKDCLVIFDDIDCIPDKHLKNKLLNLLQQILQIGRHDGCTVCFACHEVCNGHETKAVLNECHSITIFLKTMGNKKLKYLLDNYFGFDNEQVERLRSIDSRWITIFKTYPRVIMAEETIFVMQ